MKTMFSAKTCNNELIVRLWLMMSSYHIILIIPHILFRFLKFRGTLECIMVLLFIVTQHTESSPLTSVYEARIRRSTAFSKQVHKWLQMWAATFLGSLISFFSLQPLLRFLPYPVLSDCFSSGLIRALSLNGLICQDCSDWEAVEAQYTVKGYWLIDECTWSVYHSMLPWLFVFFHLL